VVVASTDGVVHAIDFATGTERWSKELRSEVHGTPVCAAGSVIVGDAAGVLHALDPASGVEHWTFPTDGAINGAPAASGSTVVAATEAGTAWAIDAATGRKVWQVALPGAVRRSVAIDADLAYVGVTPGQLLAIRTGDGSIAWEITVEGSGDIGTPAVAAGQVMAATGIESQNAAEHGVVALDAGTGAMRWRYASPRGAKVYTPAVAGDGAFVIGHDRHLVRLGARDGSLVWTTTLDAEAEALPAVADGTVYVASNGGQVLAFDATTGHELWRAPISGIPFAPVVTGGYVLVPTSAGLVVAIGDGG
jgi:outer membrane protein assembly factor BamB